MFEGFETTHMGSSNREAKVIGLTWKGHEFVDAARNETRWKKAMGIVRDKGGSITLDVLKEPLISMIKETFRLV